MTNKLPAVFKIKIKNKLPEIAKVAKAIDELAVRWKWTEKIKHDINLAIEEVVSNIIFYAYLDKLQHTIVIVFEAKENKVHITIKDDGRKYNWLDKQSEVNINAPLEERQIGGLGIHLLKKIMDKITYNRTKDNNVVLMEKELF